jgi:hypothetical protein
MQDTACNCSDSICFNVYVNGANNGCDANFGIYPDSSQQGLYWGYNYSAGQNLIYYWWWGDGTFSTEQYPTHIYIDSGYYTICLSIFDTISFCSDSVCNDYYIMKQAKMDQIHEIIFVNATGISPPPSQTEAVWSIFPNPASNDFRIQTNAGKIDEVRITDVSGRTLKTVAYYDGKNISLEQLPQETLIIQTKIDGIWSSKLLIKQ